MDWSMDNALFHKGICALVSITPEKLPMPSWEDTPNPSLWIYASDQKKSEVSLVHPDYSVVQPLFWKVKDEQIYPL